MVALVENLRGTVAGVVGAAGHLAWYLEWQAGGRRCARAAEACTGSAGTLERRAA
jgi:hypothetical protein